MEISENLNKQHTPCLFQKLLLGTCAQEVTEEVVQRNKKSNCRRQEIRPLEDEMKQGTEMMLWV